MIHIKTKFFIKPKYLNWFIGILAVAVIFFSKYVPQDIRKEVETILSITYAILFLVKCFYLAFESLDKHAFENKIKELEDDKIYKLKYSNIYDNEKLLTKYKKINETILQNIKFIHVIKTKYKFTEGLNFGNYFLIYIIFLCAYDSVEYLKPVGPKVFIVVIIFCIIFCVLILFNEGIKRKDFTSPVIFGQALSIYLLFTLGKNSYIRSYGDEIIGSYFEKIDYRTKYYVNIFPDDESSKNYRLSAEIHVYSEEEEGEPTEDSYGIEHSNTYTTKYITLEKVFWPNEGYLNFNDCQLEIGEKVQCKDQNGMSWNIELTNEKVK